jgi:hypothetical protein
MYIDGSEKAYGVGLRHLCARIFKMTLPQTMLYPVGLSFMPCESVLRPTRFGCVMHGTVFET